MVVINNATAETPRQLLVERKLRAAVDAFGGKLAGCVDVGVNGNNFQPSMIKTNFRHLASENLQRNFSVNLTRVRTYVRRCLQISLLVKV